MKLSDRYSVWVDFKTDEPICEYFDCRGEDFGYIHCDDDIPLIDIILHRADRSKTILLVISLATLGRLITEKSPWNDPLKFIQEGQIEIVLKESQRCEAINVLMANILLSEYGVAMTKEEMDHRGVVSKKILEIVRNIKLTFLSNGGIAGKYIREYFPNWRFVYIEQECIKTVEYHNVFHTSKNNPGPRDKTFVFLTRKQKILRDHRKWMIDEMKNKEYSKDAVIVVNEKFSSNDHKKMAEDYRGEYGDAWLNSNVKMAYIPCPKYYLNTNFEVACECLGQHPTDDSFYITEKTLKPIMMRHPFVMVAPMHHLKNLREMGFRTFNGLIDESYDNVENGKERIKAIGQLLEGMTLERSRRFYEESQEICKFNQDHLLNLHGRYKFDLWNNLEDFFNNYK